MPTRREFLLHTAVTSSILAGASVDEAHESVKPVSAAAKTIKTYRITHTDLVVSRIAFGSADLAGWSMEPASDKTVENAARVIHTAYDQGITFFDEGDRYGYGQSEAVFGKVLRRSPGLRHNIVLQSKVGTVMPSDLMAFDCSGNHLVSSVEGSLQRLGTDHLDILLLHWPDPLAEPHEVARAFDDLKRAGKVRYFGVSNYSVAQIELLKKTVREPLITNQIPIGLAHPDLITEGLPDEHPTPSPLTGVVDYCRLHDMQIQAYFPLRGALVNPPADAPQDVQVAAQIVMNVAKSKETTSYALALAWLLRHPARIIPVVGSTNPQHVIGNCAADGLELSREEWYTLLTAERRMPRSPER